jgi:hypothetical protein
MVNQLDKDDKVKNMHFGVLRGTGDKPSNDTTIWLPRKGNHPDDFMT